MIEEPVGPARCSACKHYCEERHPQPGVSWDRCAAAPDPEQNGGMKSCYERNNDRQYGDFKPRTVLFIAVKPAPYKWWKPYL